MRRVVETGLPSETAPYSHATVANGVLYTAHLPIRPDGSVETGSATVQTELTLSNLKKAVEAAGATLDDVNQVVIYITRIEDKPAVDEVYARYFRKPYPSRACIVISGLAVSGARIEVLAYASVPR